ncbi:probable UDP-3-O-acylglucosamine N-acyltransferase 2, mitochondrial [Coffea eugenioides]|uniref:probable UDP-3-O-acylglucosamine N-acyltransferase 2, mitochondrial n=1 Tax=Coffea eugenioides TaxID=49369 RepID=UPI000F60F7CE|nr:probable UDP-3-O-acylglucosamine N-acyltransferase 2, mitochondrial [Coffea eugenioides]XP_027162848.1 probable UDP-3-O-acylglucosamine N-acyltransferase 2, mitochondrial [Coffea eugenioides]
MAFRLRKLLLTNGCSSYNISTVMANNKNKYSTVFTPLRPISNTCMNNFLSTDQSTFKPQVDSLKSDDDAVVDQDFQKWHNGGGTFHKSAYIHRTAVIEFGAVVHSESLLGENVSIGSGVVVGPDVTIGQSTRVGYNVALTNCTIGDSCVIHNGVCIGQDGFGFLVDEQGNMLKKPQHLNVKIGNHVEIGANTCIDRGSWRDTIVGDHTKIDNLVQIGHNVQIGKNCMICGQVGIAGSVTMGDYVTLGGRVAIRDHVCIASRVRLAASSCVTKDINQPGEYGGFPAMPIGKWRRQVAAQRQTFK